MPLWHAKDYRGFIGMSPVLDSGPSCVNYKYCSERGFRPVRRWPIAIPKKRFVDFLVGDWNINCRDLGAICALSVVVPGMDWNHFPGLNRESKMTAGSDEVRIWLLVALSRLTPLL